jgi:uroporphyrin-III C-methyltransferase/precorrin-2 dehydrogenase/sirohydrochlorin ferrochelatase/uroporphyrin-III C-methyltransferase
LTLKAYNIISEIADIVVYDRLISDEILNLIPSNVEKIYAGKSCRNHVMTQDEINSTLVEEALKGKVVLRLKGGDPFIFGRGGEEAAYLFANKIPFEVVPGVNAADGCSAYCGVPLTHRGLATGVRFVTGHQQKGEAVKLDWQGLACPDTTLVLYMGLTNLDEIAKNLIKHGLSKDTPAVAIQEGTTKNQRECFSTLENIFHDATKMELKPPTLVIVGKVVGLARGSKKLLSP